MSLDLATVRSRFPGLDSNWTFFDNAGGTQILQSVMDRMQDYLVTSNVQLGASYQVSARAQERVGQATTAMAELIHAADPCEVVMGASSSQLLALLATCFGKSLTPGDEIIVTNLDHEANVGPWLRLQDLGMLVKFWNVNPETLELDLEELDLLMTDRTRLVAVTHTSNILGSIVPVREIARHVHQRGAQICVDGVAYAPHRLIDVQALEVDYYVFSFYKVFGPHYALLYGKKEHLLNLPGQNHFFVAESDLPGKFQAGNVNYELAYSMLGLSDYLSDMATALDSNTSGQEPRQQAATMYAWIEEHEESLSRRLLDFLTSKPKVRIIGPLSPSRDVRAPILSFVGADLDSAMVPAAVDLHEIGIRYGHFYSARLIEALDLNRQNGVIRVSLAHYNTVEEVDRLIGVLDPLL